MADDLNNKMILQATTQNASLVGKDVASFTETWKGPWNEIKKLTDESKILGVVLVIGLKRPSFANANWVFTHQPPKTIDEKNWPWVIRTLNIQQGPGSSGYLTITYEAGQPSWESSNEGELPSEPDPKAELSSYEKTDSRAWSLTWQAYNRSVLEYSKIPDTQLLYKGDPGSAPWTYYKNTPTGRAVAQFPEDEKERQIAKYYSKDISPQFHYPIVTCHQEYLAPDKPLFTEIGKDLDKKTSLPGECPFTFGQKWEWIMVADTGTIKRDNKVTFTSTEGGQPTTKTENTLTYVRDTSWQGAKVWDENFYGEKPWQPENG